MPTLEQKREVAFLSPLLFEILDQSVSKSLDTRCIDASGMCRSQPLDTDILIDLEKQKKKPFCSETLVPVS